jgi:hypothetical protein
MPLGRIDFLVPNDMISDGKVVAQERQAASN